jgi:ATP-dependent RNA helicase DeaD
MGADISTLLGGIWVSPAFGPSKNKTSTDLRSDQRSAFEYPIPMTTTVLEVPTELPTSDSLLFRDLPLNDDVQLAVQMSGYLAPTQVQAEIIPHMLSGQDVLAQSQTGTGKTAAFALPILSRIDMNGANPQVLVLAPTRELATQVAESFKTYGACMPKLRIAAIYGGADYDPQLRALKKGVHVVVGTPGRVLDHIKRGTLSLASIRCLVLDEADEMLNMGFLEDVEFVLENTPPEKQIALFSATMPQPIRRIADRYLKDPATVTIRDKGLTAESIEQRCVFVNEGDKPELLARMLEAEETDGVIVFTKTKESTVIVAERLCQLGLSAAALNGDLPQARRQRTVDQLKSGQLNILVATDVAARGLDVQRISHVFNYDLPHDSESYVHRIGRTGRAGRSGVAVIFLTFRQRGKLRLIEKATNQPIAVVEPPRTRDINLRRIERFKAQISNALASKDDLSVFRKIIEEVSAESGQPIELIAASLAKLARGDRPLLVSELPKSASFDPRSERGRRDSGPSRGGNPFRSGSAEVIRRPSGPPRPGMRRYQIEVGKADGVRPSNIVGAIANEAGISGSDIGPILIGGTVSTIDLPEGMPKEVFQLLQRTWVSGKQLRIKPMSGDRESTGNERERSFKKFRDAPAFGPPPSPKSKSKKMRSEKTGKRKKSG